MQSKQPHSSVLARTPLLVLLLLVLPCVGGCSAFDGHPVRQSLPRLASEVQPPAAKTLPGDPSDPRDGEVAEFLFLGLQGVWRPLEQLRARQPPARNKPLLAALPQLAAGAQRRYRTGGFGGRVRYAVAVLAAGWVPLPPARMADLITDPEVERQVLGADSFRHIETSYALAGARRDRYAVEILRVGAEHNVEPRSALFAELRELLGPSSVF